MGEDVPVFNNTGPGYSDRTVMVGSGAGTRTGEYNCCGTRPSLIFSSLLSTPTATHAHTISRHNTFHNTHTIDHYETHLSGRRWQHASVVSSWQDRAGHLRVFSTANRVVTAHSATASSLQGRPFSCLSRSGGMLRFAVMTHAWMGLAENKP